MQGGGHTSYRPNASKREQMLAEMDARPEISLDNLVGMFINDPEFVDKIDAEQQRLQLESVTKLIGFSALDGATKDEARLLQIARSNVAMYDDEVEDLIYEDPIMRELIDPRIQETHRANESYTATVRLRRTIVAYHFALEAYKQELLEPSQPTDLAAG